MFLAQMERVLCRYSLPYNPKHPVICFDERPCFLIGDVLQPIAMSQGQSKRQDYEYEKHGSCCVLLAFEPLTGRRWVKVYTQRTAKEYTDFMRFVAQQFPEAEEITLIQDNLNTHHPSSFYTQLDPAQALTLAQRFDWVYTPKHASWLNMRAGPMGCRSAQDRLNWSSRLWLVSVLTAVSLRKTY